MKTPENQSRFHAETIKEMDNLEIWMRNRRYSEKSITSYIRTLQVFFNYQYPKRSIEINEHDLITFNKDYILGKGLSATYQSQFVNALKLFFKSNQIRAFAYEQMVRPKKPYQLPKVLSSEEMEMLLGSLTNMKHRVMLAMIYSGGLRRSELLNLRITDIDSKRMMIMIRNGKGMKDRMVPLSGMVLEMLREYYKQYRPVAFLFEGQGGGRYSERSIELVLKKAVREAGIKKNVNLHTLRHSYATHLLEAGTNLRYIQELLGHKSARTTQIYTHVSIQEIGKIASPIDKLKLNNPK